jgi:large subunit ribosomal protein L3
MAAIFGKKVGMTQVFESDGRRVPVTVLEAGPCVVLQIKTPDTDQYSAIQVGFLENDFKKVNKPMKGHFSKVGKTGYRVIGEIRVADPGEYELGQVITAEVFKAGDVVDVTGKSKGKGFAGTIKRYNFARGPMTHGSKNKRPPGSVGTSATPARVIPGRKMPGHMGDHRTTIQRVQVHAVDLERNLILIHGAVPGGRNNVVMVKSTVKPKRATE